MKIEKELEDILNEAENFTKENGIEFVTPESVILCSMDFSVPKEIYTDCNVNMENVRTEIWEYLNSNSLIGETHFEENETPIRSYAFEEILEMAAASAKSAGRKELNFGQFLVALVNHDQIYASYILKKNGLETLELLETVTYLYNDGDATGGADVGFGGFQIMGDEESEPQDILGTYATNLTELAKKGELDEVIGREEEINRTIEVLCRRTKNNPIHVGDPGVGKTAVTEGLAQKIASEDVPEFLKGFEIFSVEMGSLIAGTKFRGEFEKRLKLIIQEIQKKEKAILFIDEIHTLVGAGAGNGTLDAANILKPALQKGNLRCIGSTTFEEYKKNFEKDRALVRRFQKIDILEPSRDETIKILKGLSSKYEMFHKVKYSKDAFSQAVDLSIQYFPERRLPDKAIDIIDEAGVQGKLQNRPNVTVNDIKKIVAKMARLPVENVGQKEKEKLLGLEENLKSKLFGQDEAVEKISIAVKKSRAGFRNLEKPEGSFLFVGPTGVGKTELAKLLAENLGEKLLRFDMSEYQESYTISRLIGSAPGYVGYENGGVLTEAVRKAPHSVILFDEIEKAHSDIYNTLLQVLDYGTLTDTQGRKADFKNALIIFTSNCGAKDLGKQAVGFDSGENGSKNDGFILKDAVEKTFSPEFRNRLDSVIYFSQLDKNLVKNIAKKAVADIALRLKNKKVNLEAEDEVYELIAEEGYSKEFGARNINRTAEEKIATPLVDEILFGKLSKGGTVKAKVKDGKIVFES